MAKITINGITDDPLARPLADASASDYFLMETRRSLTQRDRNELANHRVSILECVDANTYLCHYPEKSLGGIRALAYVAEIGPYAQDYKIAHCLRDSTCMAEPEPENAGESSGPGALGGPGGSDGLGGSGGLAGSGGSGAESDPLGGGGMSGDDGADVPDDSGGGTESAGPADSGLAMTTVDVVLHDNVNPDDVNPEDYRRISDRIAGAAHIDPSLVSLGSDKARIKVAPQYLARIAALDEVHHIEPVLEAKYHNNVARRILGIEAVQTDTEHTGEGQIVAVADSGLDTGKKDSVHNAFKGRVLDLLPLGRPETGDCDDPTGHGTHVAASVLGDGVTHNGDPAVPLRIRGAAPKALLILQSLYRPSGELDGLPTDLQELFEKVYVKDARIHSNSWGRSPGAGQYNQDAKEVDKFVFRNRDFVICFSAGNDGNDRQGTGKIALESVTPPGTAKNCITVGATETNRQNEGKTWGEFSPADFPAEPIFSFRMAQNPERVAAFSGRGPVESGRGPDEKDRIKPDLVAPGTFILSALSRRIVSAGAVSFPGFGFQHGTSMAAPLVAGCVAVVREFLAKKHQLPNPSAALVKALLINGARQLVDPSAAEVKDIPNMESGFGRVDLAATIKSPLEHESFVLLDEKTALADDESEISRLNITTPGATLKATLVWTDPPGAKLQNDLNLIVMTADGQERHGNMKPGAVEFDQVNNVEQVLWTNIPEGAVEVIVKAERLSTPSQTYALVIRTT